VTLILIRSVKTESTDFLACRILRESFLFCVEKFLAGREEELERSMLYTFMEVNSFVHDVRFMSFSVHDSPEKVSTRKVLGWGPQEVEPGNAAVVVQGFNLPMIVRKSRANNYRFMGPCYVHGYMWAARHLMWKA
jgi:hypothetical protein